MQGYFLSRIEHSSETDHFCRFPIRDICLVIWLQLPYLSNSLFCITVIIDLYILECWLKTSNFKIAFLFFRLHRIKDVNIIVRKINSEYVLQLNSSRKRKMFW